MRDRTASTSASSDDTAAGSHGAVMPPPPDRTPDLALELFSQARLLTGVRALVGQLTRRMGFTDLASGQVSLAVDEAICNVINHGYSKRPDGRIWISLWAIEGDESEIPEIVLTIEDRAQSVDPTTIRSRDLDDIRPGGLGVHIIREVMDHSRWEQREGGGMRLIMRKKRPADGEDEATGTQTKDHA